MTLRLRPGPLLLQRSSSDYPWTNVTEVAHRYLFEPLTLDPEVKAADLLRLVESNVTLLDVFERWGARSYLTRNKAVQAWDDQDAMIEASASGTEPISLGVLLDSLLSEVTFFGDEESVVELAAQIARQEFSEAVSADGLIAELDEKLSTQKD